MRTIYLSTLACLAVGLSGCSEDTTCPPINVGFVDDTQQVMFDESSEPGMQASIRASSNLEPGADLVLTVESAGTTVGRYTEQVDSAGDVTFAGVTLPSGDVVLLLSATGACSNANVKKRINVIDDAQCAMNLDVPPLTKSYYDVPVYNSMIDDDTATPNFQTWVTVNSSEGSRIQLFAVAEDGTETALSETKAASAATRFYVTLAQGATSIRTVCSTRSGYGASTNRDVFVDTHAPRCSVSVPQTLVPKSDTSPAEGLQTVVVGLVDSQGDNDVEGEQASFGIGGQHFHNIPVPDDGIVAVEATLDTSNDNMIVWMGARDHAGNDCVGVKAVNVDVDVDAPTTVSASVMTRERVDLTWTAPGLGGQAVPGYTVKYATVPITEANFDTVGNEISVDSAGEPGSAETLTVGGLLAGTSYYFAIAAHDGVGGRSPAIPVGPLAPEFAKSPPVVPDLLPGDQRFGYSMVAGHLNGDAYPDLVVGAPDEDGFNGAVYVYFGQASGYPATHDFKITGVGQFGNALTLADWNGDSMADVIVGSPFADGTNGELRVFFAGAAFSGVPGNFPATHNDADVVISVDPTPNWFSGAFLGWKLATAEFGDNGQPRIIAGTPGGGGFRGGVVFITPGVGGTNVVLSDNAANGTASAHYFQEPNGLYNFLGIQITNVGKLEGVGDVHDDIAISAFCPQEVYVLRGGLPQAPAGAALPITFDAGSDLHLTAGGTENCSPGVSAPYFGYAVSSLAQPGGGRLLAVGSFLQGNNDEGRVVLGNGDAVGDMTVDDPAFKVTSISGTPATSGSGGSHFGSAIINNVTALGNPDVNGDGVEDLMILGGTGGNRARLYVWYGGQSIPDQTNASADYTITEATFLQWELPTNDTPANLIWCGNSPGTQLAAVCWADASDRRDTEWDGALVVLSDDM